MITEKFIKLKLSSYYQLLKPTSQCLCYRSFVHSHGRKIRKNFVGQTTRGDIRALTANVFRQEKTYKAIVQEVFSASSTIKIIRLFVNEPGFSFKAGQWVDFYKPGISDVTGYSMTSPPNEARENGILELAVKYGKFPPTHWVHTSCSGGDEVHIRVGGDFFYDPQPGTLEAEADLLLVGGGVGINPMVSILCEYNHLLRTQSKDETAIKPGKVHLLYSAKTEDELVFKDTFTQMESEHPSLICHYFVTRTNKGSSKPGIKYSRIKEEDVIDSVHKLQNDKTLCYVCGPSTMTDDVANWLQKIGIKKEYIRFEKWW